MLLAMLLPLFLDKFNMIEMKFLPWQPHLKNNLILLQKAYQF